MTTQLRGSSVGTPMERVDGRLKVQGRARYAAEQPVDRPAYLRPVQATVARGTLVVLDTTAAESLPGVLAVLTHRTAPRLAAGTAGELAVLQSPEVRYRGEFVAAVVAESLETARQAAALVRVEYRTARHETAFDVAEPDGSAAEADAAGGEREVGEQEIVAALAGAPVHLDETYRTPATYHSPMETHTTVAAWDGRDLTVHESTQGVHSTRGVLAAAFGLAPEQVRVIAPYVGGGFGSKLETHAQAVLAVMAALALPGRAVTVALTRQQMFGLSGYRPPIRQRVRMSAGPDGRLAALAVDVVQQSSRAQEFTEGADGPARMMYAAPARRTTNRLATLDVPVPTWMRAPGCTPGMFALEVAMDELAAAAEVDPIELRIRNEPDLDPETGEPHAYRHLTECLRLGAGRFGWIERDPAPRARRRGDWWVGTGVAAATHPYSRETANTARIRVDGAGGFAVEIAAAEIGTGSWTVLTQIAADALGCAPDRVRLEIGDSRLPRATVSGGSFGTVSWAAAIIAAAEAFRAEHGDDPAPGAVTERDAPGADAGGRSRHSYGAHFAEVRVNADTGEVRVSRMLGVFSVGRVVNPRTARSQLIGGMTMGIGMALHEHGVTDPSLGAVVTQDLVSYHVPTCADVEDLEAIWIDEPDVPAGIAGARGVGEIGIVGVAAAIANAAHHATGVRVRDLPLTLDHFLA